MAIYELNFPTIPDGERLAFGGDQDWCRTKWHRMSGCGPTAAANISAYYASADSRMASLYRGNTESFDKEEFTDCIEELFNFITPGFMGYPYPARFIRMYRQYALSKGVRLNQETCFHGKTVHELFDFTVKGINTGNPVALLVLGHRAPEMKEDSWHWVTVSGYTDGDDGDNIIVSNCGERQVWKSDMIFERHCENTVKLLHFVPELSHGY